MRDWALIPAYWAKAFTEGAFWKWCVAAAAVAIDWIFGSGTARTTAMLAGGMMVLDTVTGLCAAWYTHQPFASGKFSRVLVKVVAYGVSILVAAMVPRAIPGLGAWHDESVSAVAGVIFCTETLSVLENIDKLGFKSMRWIKKLIRTRMQELQQVDDGRESQG